MAQLLVKKDDDHDDDLEYSPFIGIEKGAVLQEARVFNDTHLDPRRCSQVITKLLYLLNQGESFTKVEATEVFFSVTRLFQSEDIGLRRMVYLIIKELNPSVDEVIIVTSALRKDITIDMYRANAIRVLCRIIDGSLLTQIERRLKEAVLDKNPVVSSAVLVSGLHMLKVQEAVQSRAALVQFHALALLHQIRQNDRLAVSKLVGTLTRGAVSSPLAQCLLIRYTSQIIRDMSYHGQSGERPFYDFLESCLRHKAEMVILEAARAITELDGVTSRELTPAITVLQLFLSSPKPVLRFAAVRTLNKVAMTHPMAVTNCNIDMESLISDQNRIKITNELLKQHSYGRREIPYAKENGLLHLCEFIEDCEFTYLSTQILHFLGFEGPNTSDPSRFIRYIYNRVHLENATVRAAAVCTLAKFGFMVEALKPRITVLLKRCIYDSDDEVRDRATLFLSILGNDGPVDTDKVRKEFIFGSLEAPLVNMETSLKNYEPSEEAFDVDSVSKEVKSQWLAEKKAKGKKPTGLSAPPPAPTSGFDAYEKILSSIPEFASFGKLFKSSFPVELTEAETEYTVNVVKHIFDNHVVFQYNCTNTVLEQLLERVNVIVDASEAEEFSELSSKPINSLPYDSPGQAFLAFEKPEGVPVVGKFSNTLTFIVKEVDINTGEPDDDGVEDEYQLEDLEVVATDYMLNVGVSNFRNAWENMDPENELVDEYGLGQRDSLAEAVKAVTDILGMQSCEGTETVASNAKSHTRLLSGLYIGNVKVLVKAQFGMDSTKEIVMKLAVRAEDRSVSDAIHAIVACG
ncbi:hypothetical protein AALP_AA2G108400 [Arabis alpina]|uniref:Coatomer subunit gamma n=1 Tax=Arabis alpina TaxID=50452 RepID=A0A087HGL9_ARAAL|nr:hypothetical protein AALP_AA2G108400 [Arabis alpina]